MEGLESARVPARAPWSHNDRRIETRRHDTPAYFAKFQQEILAIMAQGNNIKEVRALMPKVKETFEGYKLQLKECRVPLVDLLFTKMLSKDSNAYSANTAQNLRDLSARG
ncbi:MAG: hypothetical protein HRF40_11665 [Nitrososphaera sp.]